MANWKPDVFAYLDFRAYLRAYYDAAKAHTRAFSYRYFARRAGFTSPNFLKLVIDGDRNLSTESVERFSVALGLTGSERHFFADLVAFGQATSDAERNEAYERVAASRTYREARRIEVATFAYLSRWYIPVIREMTLRASLTEDPGAIAARLIPAISADEASSALSVLLDLGLIARGTDGVLRPAEPTLTTGHELRVRSLAVANYHREMLCRAADAIENVPREERDISALTVVVSDATVAEFKRRIHAFRERLLDLAVRDPSPDRVMQINVQLFPLTHRLSGP